ncbi:hypothetical protein DBR06_SOUSAS2010105, partial [Sousa chinensis]
VWQEEAKNLELCCHTYHEEKEMGRPGSCKNFPVPTHGGPKGKKAAEGEEQEKIAKCEGQV